MDNCSLCCASLWLWDGANCGCVQSFDYLFKLVYFLILALNKRLLFCNFLLQLCNFIFQVLEVSQIIVLIVFIVVKRAGRTTRWNKCLMVIDDWMGRLATNIEFDTGVIQNQPIPWISNSLNRVIIPVTEIRKLSLSEQPREKPQCTNQPLPFSSNSTLDFRQQIAERTRWD